MSELIDREATVKQICKMGEMVGGHDRDVVISIALFVQDDKTAFPTVERPHGEWIEKHCDYGVYYRCSNCHKMPPNYECDYKEGAIKTNFCPNCGASMSANDRQVTGKLNSEIEKSKSEIAPDYRDGWRLKEGDSDA